MWDNATIMMLVEGTFVTLYMTLVSTFMGYVLGLPMGIALVITAPKGLRPNKIIYKILDVIVNIVRSIPFLILLILVIPLTRIIVGQSYGPTATIVPLTLAAAPFIARMVESSLLEVDPGVIEAAQSMGANIWTIIWKVMLAESRTSLLVNATIALGTILGYSAMAGAVGGGGRYDKMIGKFTGNDVPACGFSIGFERIILLLMESGFKIPESPKRVAYLVEKKYPAEKLVEVMKQAKEARENGQQVLVVRMNKNKKFQKEQLAKEGYEEFVEFFNR